MSDDIYLKVYDSEFNEKQDLRITTENDNENPHITIEPDGIYRVFYYISEETDIRYSTSQDMGHSWTETAVGMVDETGTSIVGEEFTIERVLTTFLICYYYAEAIYLLKGKKNLSGGITWDTKSFKIVTGLTSSQQVNLLFEDGILNLWYYDSEGEIKLKQSYDLGYNWSDITYEPTDLSLTDENARFFNDIGSHIDMVGYDGENYLYSELIGRSDQKVEKRKNQFSITTGAEQYIDILSNSKAQKVVTYYKDNEDTGEEEIKLSKSDDMGITWSEIEEENG